MDSLGYMNQFPAFFLISLSVPFILNPTKQRTRITCKRHSDSLEDADILTDFCKDRFHSWKEYGLFCRCVSEQQETTLNYMQAAVRLAEVGAELMLHNEEQDIRTS